MNKIFTFFLVVILLGCQTPKDKTAAGKKPTNIIFIMADDLGYGDIGVYGQSLLKTPNLDRLARGGMRFTQHYSGATVCAPSRSSLMTGQHTGHTFIRGNSERGFTLANEGQCALESDALTIAEVLKDNGYKTGAFGYLGPWARCCGEVRRTDYASLVLAAALCIQSNTLPRLSSDASLSLPKV